MRFEVPQFIDVEDKLFGPFTFKQFIYIAGGAGIVYTLFKLLPIYIAVPVAIPFAAFAAALVFYKPNNRPFIKMVESAANYFLKHRFYLWKHQTQKKVAPTAMQNVTTETKAETENKLQDLAWSLDILDQNK